ncbi:MAG: hypothetical protein SFX73_29980 [Kofleriaceae bacterium]|nr:hypothetical protein [Kofleriaceae bacterium]
MRAWPLAIVCAALTACGNDRELTTPDGAPTAMHDVRVPIPVADPKYYDIVTPDLVLQPGEERMYCFHVTNEEADLAVRHLVGMQGGFGHHIALFTTTDPKPAGTVEDCTSPEANAGLEWFVLTFDALPSGHAIKIPSGFQYVLQFHYINAGDLPLLVRDVARLERVPIQDVTTWVSTFISTDIGLALPPGPSTRSWDCVVDRDRELLVTAGHMHELGNRFRIEVGPDTNSLETIYTVDSWEDHFRDSPPTTNYYSAPMHLPAGSIVRTTCEFMNTGSTVVRFPQEMCTIFAYTAAPTTHQCQPAQ